MRYVLYNPLASNKSGEKKARTINERCPNPYYEFVDITALSDGELDEIMADEHEVVLSGGDGTLNRFINLIGENVPDKPIYFYPSGSGNDFMRDVSDNHKEDQLIKLNDYIKHLPVIEVNGKSYRFINGAGYGIDGYSCAMVEKKMKGTGKKGSYTLEAFLGLLKTYTPGTARVTVDGVTREYENVWMISCMQGRYFGGGVMIAPNQDRLNAENSVSVVVVSCKSRLRLITVFPSIFKGKHLKYTELVHVFTGKNVSVEVDEPSSLQVDGDPITGVTSYTVKTYQKETETV